MLLLIGLKHMEAWRNKLTPQSKHFPNVEQLHRLQHTEQHESLHVAAVCPRTRKSTPAVPQKNTLGTPEDNTKGMHR